MERRHRAHIGQHFRHGLNGTRIVCLDISNVYAFEDPELVRLSENKVARHLPTRAIRDTVPRVSF